MAAADKSTPKAKRVPVAITLKAEDFARLENAKWELRKEVRHIVEDAILAALDAAGL